MIDAEAMRGPRAAIMRGDEEAFMSEVVHDFQLISPDSSEGVVLYVVRRRPVSLSHHSPGDR